MMLTHLAPAFASNRALQCENKSIMRQQFAIDKDKAEKQDTLDLARINKLSRAIKVLEKYESRFCS